MKVHDALRTLGYIAGQFFPQQALRVLQGRDFNAALDRVDDALAVAEESRDGWEAGEINRGSREAIEALRDAMWCHAHNDIRGNCKYKLTTRITSDFPDCTGPCAQAADLDDRRPACAARAAGKSPAGVSSPPTLPPAGRSADDDWMVGMLAAANIVAAEAQSAWRTYLDSPMLNPVVDAMTVCRQLDRITQAIRTRAAFPADAPTE